MNFSEAASRARAVTDRAEASLARDCARAGANEFLAELHVTTPVETGALRASERVWRVFGGGTTAQAIVGPNIIYGRFRNDGGTITGPAGEGAGDSRAGVLRETGNPARKPLHGAGRG